MTEIEDVIQGLDKNIEFLKNPYRLENNDIKGLLLDILGMMKDMWEKFNNVFKMMDEVHKIEESAKEELCREKNDLDKDQDLRNLYQ